MENNEELKEAILEVSEEETTETDSEEFAEEDGKKISFDTHMTSAVLYDYQIYYAYTNATGILATCLGILGVLIYLRYRNDTSILFLVFGILLIFYLPVVLKYRSFMAAKLNPVYKNPLHYEIGKHGISVSQGEVSQTLPWEKCTKAITTPKSIVVYSGRKNACIFPKKDLGEYLPALIAVIAENMKPSQVKINTNITL